MLSTVELLARCVQERTSTPGLETGLSELDELTGGLRRGCVWIVVGRPGAGKTTLAAQWGAQLAEAGMAVQLVCPREPVRPMARRLLCTIGKLALRDLPDGLTSAATDRRLADACTRLAELDLSLFPADGRGFVPETDPHAATASGVLVIDDADLVGGVTPQRVDRWRTQGFMVVLTLPRHMVLMGEEDEAPLEPGWARVADVILEVRHRGLPPLPRYLAAPNDDASAPVLRPGEADLLVHHHRWGPARTIGVIFQPHYARFLDRITGEPT